MRLNYKRIVSFFVTLTFFCLGCVLSIADDMKTVDVTDAMVKELLLKIEKANKNLKEKNFSRQYLPILRQ